MLQSTTIPTIFISNFVAFLLALTMLISNQWRWRRGERENTLLVRMLALLSGVCVTEPIAFIIEGRAGVVYKVLLYVCDSYTYGADLIVATMWLWFIVYHLLGGVSKKTAVLINTPVVIGVSALLLNFFVPVVFVIDDANCYQRLPAYFGFLIAEMALFLASFVIYLYVRMKGNRLRFFNFSVYMIPVVLGVLVQTLFFGISMIAPCIIVSLCGLMTTVQNEVIFKDNLTGLYNRYYLDQICKEIRLSRKPARTFVMLDLNGFKAINDDLGHLVGDQALVETSAILRTAVKARGEIIRYAGDEFVIVLDGGAEDAIRSIRDGFDAFNATEKRDYKLTVSLGYSEADLRKTTSDEVLNRIDKLMYEDKRIYYTRHGADRRRRSSSQRGISDGGSTG